MCDGHAPSLAHPGVLKLERDKGRSRGGPSSVAGDVQRILYSDVCVKWKDGLGSSHIGKLALPVTLASMARARSESRSLGFRDTLLSDLAQVVFRLATAVSVRSSMAGRSYVRFGSQADITVASYCPPFFCLALGAGGFLAYQRASYRVRNRLARALSPSPRPPVRWLLDEGLL